MEQMTAHSAASKSLIDNRETVYRLSMYFLLFAIFLMLPSTAHAASDPLSQTLCIVVNWFTGRVGRGIATLGIIVLGIGAMMGKVSWQMALTVAVGVSIMFSGAKVVDLLVSAPGASAQGLCDSAPSIDPLAISNALCSLASLATQPAGRAFGTLAVIFLGVGALMGKVSGPVAILLATGLATFYSAENIAGMLVGGAMQGGVCTLS